MIIIGAGMSGMLAGQYFRHMNPTIVEKQKSLPNNHKALLRFRSDAVSKLTGIPFKKVRVTKMINYKGEHHTKSNLHFNNLYSQKVIGAVRERSLGNLDACDRYIAPEDFISQLSAGLNIMYDVDSIGLIRNQMSNPEEPIISTMPIVQLAKILDYNIGNLESRKIWTVTFDIPSDCDVYQTVYYPNPSVPMYRISITGKKFIAEFSEDPKAVWEPNEVLSNLVHFLEHDFGISISQNEISYIGCVQYNEQKHGKLLEPSGNELKEFMRWATHNFNIYSLGRWGTHRQLLMDDVVEDIHVIHNMIRSNRYSR